MIRVGMVSGPSRLDDASFLFSAWSGLTRARAELGISTTILEATDHGDVKTNVDFLTYDGYDVIWCVGYDTRETVLESAAKNPGVTFCTVDVEIRDRPQNVVSVMFSEHEGAYLAGYAAATLSATGSIGFIGGVECGPVERFRIGYEAGARAANPAILLHSRYAGSFIKYNAGRVTAEALFDAGCDIMFHAAGSAGKGVIRVAKDRQRYAIGVDTDQAFLAPSAVITSVLKRVDLAVESFMRDYVAGNETEREQKFGIADGAVGLTPITHPGADASLEGELAAIRERIVAGELDVAAE